MLPPVKIALLHPTYWPEVRRGSERLIHDIAVGLAGRGHDVTLLTTHDGASATSEEEGIRVIRSRRVPYIRPLRWYEDHIANAPTAAYRLWRGDFDVAHAFFAVEAWAAARLRARGGGPPFVFSMHGIPVRKYLVDRRYRMEMLSTAIRGSSATTVLSEAAAEPFRRYLLHDPVVVPGGVRTADFAVEEPPRQTPTIVCAASLRDPRKRAELLLEGFAGVREQIPDAELRIVRPRDPLIFAWEAPERPEGVSWVEADDVEALARVYASASASVLPAVDEAFGLVLAESLAAGTPVVAARSGACPEIVDDPAIGRLFEPDDPAELTRAMLEAVELGSEDGTADRCRQAAARYDIDRALDAFEGLYSKAAATA